MKAQVFAQLEANCALCERHHVKRLWLFGSALTDDFEPSRSDLNFLVEYESGHAKTAWDDYWGVREGLESMFERNVDLVDRTALRNTYVIRAIESSREVLYAA